MHPSREGAIVLVLMNLVLTQKQKNASNITQRKNKRLDKECHEAINQAKKKKKKKYNAADQEGDANM